MSDNKVPKHTMADIDAALDNLQKSQTEGITLEKGVINERANGGAQTKEKDYSTGSGRKQTTLADKDHLPAEKDKGNFATKYPMDKGGAEGSALSGAVKTEKPLVAKLPQRGLTKAADKSGASAGTSSPGKSGATSSPKSMKKAADKSGDSSAKSGASSAKSDKSKGSKKSNPFAKMEKGVAAPSVPEIEGTQAPQLDVKKSIEYVASARKHLKKALEEGSEKELDATGARLVSAKDHLQKAFNAGVDVPSDVVKGLNKACSYFSKALTSYENDNAESHLDEMEGANRNMKKAIAAYDTFEKSLIVNKLTAEVKPLEKSVSAPEKTVVDATPAIKEMFAELKASLGERESKEKDFRKSLTAVVTGLTENLKAANEELESLKNKPNVRKSISNLQEVKSPMDNANDFNGALNISQIGASLEKGFHAGLIDVNKFLAWDVDKDMPEVAATYQDLANKIDARLGR